MNYWTAELTESEAVALITGGREHFDYSVKQGAGFCAGRARGSWDANEAFYFAFYRAAQRAAEVAA